MKEITTKTLKLLDEHIHYQKLSCPRSTKVASVQNEIEPRREKTGLLHMRKQRRRSASR